MMQDDLYLALTSLRSKNYGGCLVLALLNTEVYSLPNIGARSVLLMCCHKGKLPLPRTGRTKTGSRTQRFAVGGLLEDGIVQIFEHSER